MVKGQQKKLVDERLSDLSREFEGNDRVWTWSIVRADQYDPEYCKIVIEAMRNGFDKKGAAGSIGISWATFELWEDKYPEFKEAAAVGESLHAAFWQKQGIKNLTFTPTGKQINSKVYGVNMAARFGWGDSKQVDDKKQKRDLAFELVERRRLEIEE